MDKRKNYYLVLDVEGVGECSNALTYDLGFAIADKKGNIYEKHSYVIREIFEGQKELMKSAYYANKIPNYIQDISAGKRQVVDFKLARWILINTMKKWNVVAVCAYNAKYDRNALNNTLQFVTNGEKKYFFPYGTEIYDIWTMCAETICRQKTYHKLAKENNWLTNKGFIGSKAEQVYKYVIGNYDFVEEHTGLEDVLIEAQLMAKAFSLHKKMDKGIRYNCWRLCQQVG